MEKSYKNNSKKKSKKIETPDHKKKESWDYLIYALSEASRISFSLVFFPIVFLLLGVWLDKKLNTIPLFIIIGIISGLLIGLFQATQIKNKYKK